MSIMEELFDSIVDTIAEQSWAVVDNFFNPDEVSALIAACDSKFDQDLFKRAGVGKQIQFNVNQEIRRDSICWLDWQSQPLYDAERVFLQRMEDFMQHLNRTCYLGLRTHELHYARYDAGSFYKRHLDQFQRDGDRKITVICYLNPNWQESDGGQLRIYHEHDTFSDILPLAGRLICFRSDALEHEVLVANRLRRSLTGWLKTS